LKAKDIWWITGASSGIGRALALRMAQAGMRVVVSARSETALDALSNENENIIPYPVDVSDGQQVAKAVEWIESSVGQIHGAVLNAGIYEPMLSNDYNHEVLARTFDVNVLGVSRALDQLIPVMLNRNCGHIAIMASLAGWRGLPNAVAYGASKAAVTYMAETLRLELFSSGIKIQVIHPGFVDTPATKVNTFKMPFLMTVEQAADQIMAGLKRNSFTISFPRRFALIFRVLRLLPDHLYFTLTRRSTRSRRS
jgi:NADP-dependent 3-hydroxy acid dehydrogenase YdfG